MGSSTLSLENVSRHFGAGESRVDAVREVTFDVRPGEVVALVGPSGSGKSTLLSMAGALLSPSDGVVRLGDSDISTMSAGDRTRLRLERIGFIFQGSNLVSYLTTLEQLQFIGNLLGMDKKESTKRAESLLEELGMEKRKGHYPEQLSGGERQRIAIARSLMNQPELILADEPTASLDSHRALQVVELLASEVHRRNAAGILVTHDERLLNEVDRVLRISDGQVKAEA